MFICLLYILSINSKTQRYLDGRFLIKIPPRTIEWRPFILTSDSELFLHRYLETFAADALEHFLSRPENLESAECVTKYPHYAMIRSLMSLISRCITSPRTINLRNLDHLRRLLGNTQYHTQRSDDSASRIEIQISAAKKSYLARARDMVETLVPLMTAEEILFRVQQAGQGVNGGMNRCVRVD